MRDRTDDDLDLLLRSVLRRDPPRRGRPTLAGLQAIPLAIVGLAVIVLMAAVVGPLAGQRVAAPGAGISSPPLAVPVGGRLLVLQEAVLSIVGPDGGREREITRLDGHRLSQVSPDGNSVLATTPSVGTRLVRISLTDGRVTTLATAPTGFVLGPGRWSADGKFVYFVQHAEAGGAVPMSVLRVPAGGGTPEDVTPRANVFIDDFLSLPDGRLITVSQLRAGGESAGPFLSDGDGRNAVALLAEQNLRRTCRYPTLSPEGTRVLLVCSWDGFQDPSLVIYDLTTQGLTQIPFRGNGAMVPTWSPTGNSVVMAGGPPVGCKPEIVWLDLDGTQEVAVEDPSSRFRVIAVAGQSTALVHRIPCRDGQTTGPATLQWIDRNGRTRDVIRATSTQLPQVIWMPPR